ncbi:flagellar protein FlaG [Aquibacillus sediminis]|uniref:flagellar protein FlaG n=1 Tax=Aquibacillus sediminis TaxID=2574734 RepID=UPI00110849DE|nr:flagellar protein FlaG [Aquibacillus sediminis]
MSVGKIISGSQLLQKAEHTEFSTSARERSIGSQTNNVESQLGRQTYHDVKEMDKQLDKEQVNELVESINEFLEPTRTSLKFEMHEKLDRHYVQVIDQETEEVIKEIPPKKLLDAYASMAELMGFIVDETV